MHIILFLWNELKDIYEMETYDLFIGEIVGSYSEEKYMSAGKLDMAKMDPLLLTMPDNNYWKVGEIKKIAAERPGILECL